MSVTTLQTPKNLLSTSKHNPSTSTATTIRFAEPPLPPHAASSAKKRELQPIWSWTFKAEAIAECSIKDALEMTENKIENFDFFWLGRIPCRTIQTVGIVVGVQVYDKKVVYTVDDGTGVIDCEHIVKHATFEPAPNVSKYVMPAPLQPLKRPEPVAVIGDFVQVVGRIRPSFETRKLIAQSVVQCCATDEMTHTRKVRQLHATYYDLDEEWVLPPPPTPVPVTPKRTKLSTPASIPNPSTGKSTIASSVSSSPVLPVIRESVPPASPRKLRHPSRLHTQDLTDSTFRIYLKHYMDHAPIPLPPEEDDDSDLECPPSSQPDPWATPRPTRSQAPSSTRVGPSRSLHSSSQIAPIVTEATPIQGFTLSYLRRVPELALLATRVTQAHARRKAREERKKLQEAGNVLSKSQSQATKELPPDKAAPKIKRLFQWAIKQLYKDGAIMLWDGPVRRIPTGEAGEDAAGGVLDLSALWKSSTANSTLNATMGSSSSLPLSSSSRSNHPNSSMFSSTTNIGVISSTLQSLAEEQGVLSDPSPLEEAYVSLTPLYLSTQVMGVVRDVVDRNASAGRPYAGVGEEDVVRQMRRDDRWRYLGAWSVGDALGVLEREGKVWKMADGRWDVTMCD